jgi:hypothetical protein
MTFYLRVERRTLLNTPMPAQSGPLSIACGAGPIVVFDSAREAQRFLFEALGATCGAYPRYVRPAPYGLSGADRGAPFYEIRRGTFRGGTVRYAELDDAQRERLRRQEQPAEIGKWRQLPADD